MPKKNEVVPYPFFGELPPRAEVEQYQKVYRYAELLHKVRQQPNRWAMVAVVDQGSKYDTALRCRSIIGEMSRWLHKSYPLEVWNLSVRRIVTHYSRREIWVRYNGTLTPEEILELREARKEKLRKGKQNSDAKRAAREAVARLEALAVHKEMAELRRIQQDIANRR